MAQLTRTTPMRLMTLLAVLAIVVAGCGGDTGESASEEPDGERFGPGRLRDCRTGR